jgi:hypothetical protein
VGAPALGDSDGSEAFVLLVWFDPFSSRVYVYLGQQLGSGRCPWFRLAVGACACFDGGFLKRAPNVLDEMHIRR